MNSNNIQIIWELILWVFPLSHTHPPAGHFFMSWCRITDLMFQVIKISW